MPVDGLSNAMNVAISGMQAQITRIDVTANNIAHMQTTRTAAGGPYRPKSVVITDNGEPHGGVQAEIVEIPEPTRPQFSPNHPDANADGFVDMPNVDIPREMVNLMDAANDFRANLAAVKTTQDIHDALLDILA